MESEKTSDLAAGNSQNLLPLWIMVSGWIALLVILLSMFFPRLEAPLNIAGGLGGMVLLASVIIVKTEIIGKGYIRGALLVFVVSCIVSTVIPNLKFLPDTAPIQLSFREFWNTIIAIGAGGLILLLCRSRRERFALVFLITLAVLLIAVGVPVERWLSGMIDSRISGTKGGANRYAVMVFLAAYWALYFGVHKGISLKIPRWALVFSGIFIILAPYLMFRKKMQALSMSADFCCGNFHLGISILFGVVILSGVVFILCAVKGGRWRQLAVWVVLAILAYNVTLSMSRTILVMFFLLLLGIVFMRIRRRAFFILGGGLLAISIAFVACNNVRFQRIRISDAIKVREGIRISGMKMFRKSPFLGVGYGRHSFHNNWISNELLDNMPDLEHRVFDHAHNIWVHLLATQGVFGWVSFHLLWLAVLFCLIKSLRKDNAPLVATRSKIDESSVIAAERLGILQVGVLAVLLLQINGILMYPLQECNEILVWSIAAFALVVAKGADQTGGHYNC